MYVRGLGVWALEIRPIIDKQVGRWYRAFHPTLDRSFHGYGVPQVVTIFAPLDR